MLAVLSVRDVCRLAQVLFICFLGVSGLPCAACHIVAQKGVFVLFSSLMPIARGEAIIGWRWHFSDP